MIKYVGQLSTKGNCMNKKLVTLTYLRYLLHEPSNFIFKLKLKMYEMNTQLCIHFNQLEMSEI